MSDDGLFEGAPATKAARKRAQQQESDGVVQRLEAAFEAAHERRWNCKPIRSYGRDRKHLKDLAAQLGEPEVLALIAFLFETNDFQVTRRNYTVGDFFILAPRLRLLMQGGTRHDERTAANIEAAARATGRKR